MWLKKNYKKRQDNDKSKIQQTEYFFMGQRTDAAEEGVYRELQMC